MHDGGASSMRAVLKALTPATNQGEVTHIRMPYPRTMLEAQVAAIQTIQ